MITGNGSPTLVYYVLVTFSDLEEQKHIITCLYNITLAHVSSVNIKEKPYKATLILEKGMCSMLGEEGGGGGGLPPEITIYQRLFFP